MMHDVVIRNGYVIDGSGRPRYRADVAVDGGRVAAVGRIVEDGRRVIDATGHVVTPGFIDGHTHMDAQVLWDHLGSCSSWHGVTTVVMGNCGFTLAPSRPSARELTISSLERSEELQRTTLEAAVEWRWETFAEYLDVVDNLPKAINYGAYIGHSALRTWAMGERGFETECSQNDRELMKQELRAALDAGAIGLSTSRSVDHQTTDDQPVASRWAGWDEVCELVGVMGDMGKGIFQIALEPAAKRPDRAARKEFLDRLGRLAIGTRVPTTFGFLPRQDDPTYTTDLLEFIDATSEAGGYIIGQSHSRGMQVLLSFRSKLPFDTLPGWAQFRALPLETQLQRLADPEVRQALVDETQSGDYRRRVGTDTVIPDYEAMRVLINPVGNNPSVADVARQRGVTPVDALIDLGIETGFGQVFVQPITATDPEALLPVLQHPRTIMTFSDSGAHVESIMDCSVQTHLLAYWVRQRAAFTLEEAVRMITLIPALFWGFTDRGLIREGMTADLNVFDPATIGPQLPTIEHDLPGGGTRVVQKAEGMLATLVAGEVVFEQGEHTGALPGTLIRSGARQPAKARAALARS